MTTYESELMSHINKCHDAGEFHCVFEIPNDPDELERLKNALISLDEACKIEIVAAPWSTEDDFIMVEKLPGCLVSKPSS